MRRSQCEAPIDQSVRRRTSSSSDVLLLTYSSYKMTRTSLSKSLKLSRPIIRETLLPPPRLWNAHKPIKTGRTHRLPRWPLKRVEDSDNWRTWVTPDIVEHIDKAKPSPEDHAEILQNPHAFFSKPRNVPVEFRKQVYLYGN